MIFQQNLLEKAYFMVKMIGPAMVRRPVLTFGKRPEMKTFILADNNVLLQLCSLLSPVLLQELKPIFLF